MFYNILIIVKSLLNMMVIFEIKLNDNISVNLYIFGYLFVCIDFKFYVGGFGLYVFD